MWFLPKKHQLKWRIPIAVLGLAVGLYYTYQLRVVESWRVEEEPKVVYAMPDKPGDAPVNNGIGSYRVDIPDSISTDSGSDKVAADSVQDNTTDNYYLSDSDIYLALEALAEQEDVSSLTPDELEKRERFVRWKVKWEDLDKRQKALHERILNETDSAIFLNHEFIGSILKVIPFSDSVREEIAEAAADKGEDPNKVLDFVSNAPETSKSPEQVIDEYKALVTSSDDIEKQNEMLSQELHSLMTELREIL